MKSALKDLEIQVTTQLYQKSAYIYTIVKNAQSWSLAQTPCSGPSLQVAKHTEHAICLQYTLEILIH